MIGLLILFTRVFCERKRDNQMKELNNNPILIAVDHGYGFIKTPHFVFPACVKEVPAKPSFTENILQWVGHMYVVGEGHKEFISDKAQDNDYRLLTMAAVALELKRIGRTEASVYLAVGLPLDWAGQQKDSFQNYLRTPWQQNFTFNDEEFSIQIEDVLVYPQGFAAIADKLSSFTGMNMLCDIGNGTLSLMYINNGLPVPGKVFTEQLGVYQCTLKMKEVVMKQCHCRLDDAIAEDFIRTGQVEAAPIIRNAMMDGVTSYVNSVMTYIREHDYNPMMMRLYMMGGGACLLKNFGGKDIQADINDHRILLDTDVHATAKGYERLARSSLIGKGVQLL